MLLTMGLLVSRTCFPNITIGQQILLMRQVTIKGTLLTTTVATQSDFNAIFLRQQIKTETKVEVVAV